MAVQHGWSATSVDDCTRSVTWGSASADRSITARKDGLGLAAPTSSEDGAMRQPGFGRERLWRAVSTAFDCRLAGNDMKATGRSDAALAVDEGNSSKGMKSVAGKAPRASHRPPGRATGPREPETRRTLVRQRGATNPQTNERSKPSRWCETTRAEHAPARSGAGDEGSSLPGVDARWGSRRRGERESHERKGSPRGDTNARGSASKWRPRP
jgi:hypothetical protein